ASSLILRCHFGMPQSGRPGTHIPPPFPPPHAGEGRVGVRPVFMGSGLDPSGRPGMTTEPYEFGPRSIETGCQRLRPLPASTAGLTQDKGHLPLSTSDNSSPTRRRRAGSKRAVAEATCAVRMTLSIRKSGLLPP